MASMKGKVIAITGAASGIGLETANILFKRGASLSLADLNGEVLKSMAMALEAEGSSTQMVTTTVLDVRKSDHVNAWITGTVDAHGRLDGAANVAGVVTKPVPIMETTDADWDFVMGVNCTGVFYCMRAQASAMVKRGGGGSIVNASSVAGLVAAPGMCAYGASKHGVAGLTKTAAREMGALGIRVNAVAPGPTDTPMVRDLEEISGQLISNDRSALKRRAHPAEIAKSIAYLLSDESSNQTGSILVVDGGWIA